MSANGGNLQLCKAVLCAGLYPNLVKVIEDKDNSNNGGKGRGGGYNDEAVKLITREGEECALHPCSTNFDDHSLTGYLMYHERVKTSAVYLRDCTAVSPYPLMLFGGYLRVWHREQVVTVDNYLAFHTPRRVAVLVRLLRDGLEEIMRRKISAPEEAVSAAGERVVSAVGRLLTSEVGNMAENDAKRLEEAQKRVEQKALLKAERAAMKALVGAHMEGGGGHGYEDDTRPGDWRCPKCAANVFASKSACFKCGTAKPEGEAGKQSGEYGDGGRSGGYGNGGRNGGHGAGHGTSHGGGHGAGHSDTRPGDWSCPKCHANVFASKSNCFKCSTPKPEESALSVNAPSWEQEYQNQKRQRAD
jgi:rubredoxin